MRYIIVQFFLKVTFVNLNKKENFYFIMFREYIVEYSFLVLGIEKIKICDYGWLHKNKYILYTMLLIFVDFLVEIFVVICPRMI